MKKLHWLPLSLFSLGSYTPKPFPKFQKKINYQGKLTDASVDIGDVVYLLSYLYQTGSSLIPPEAGGVNFDGDTDLEDVLHLQSWLLRGGQKTAPVALSASLAAIVVNGSGQRMKRIQRMKSQGRTADD